jgi:V/A-type H+/Na+-transporting ATPase subunit G/H
MNEKRIEQVLEIERQAQAILSAATHEAEQLPAHAEQEAQQLIDKARLEAQEEARQMLEKAQAEQETAGILSKADDKNRDIEKLAMKNLDSAVAFVLERVIGKA